MSKAETFIRTATTSEQPLILEFAHEGKEYLVKNFTDGDVYVALKESATKEESALIPAQMAQTIVRNKGGYYAGSNIVQIIPTATSEKGVEVQCLKW